MVAFIDEETKKEECDTTTTKTGNQRASSVYERRNCLKKLLYRDKIKEIPNISEFKKQISSIDELRNISAHAFTSDYTEKNIATEIQKTIKLLKTLYTKRFSKRSAIEKLSEVFS